MGETKITPKQKAIYEKMAQDATVDCYNEMEMFSGWTAILEDEMILPCTCIILGEEAKLNGVEQAENEETILGVIKKGKEKVRIPLQDIKLQNPLPHNQKWIDAYKYWLKNC